MHILEYNVLKGDRVEPNSDFRTDEIDDGP
jgi:hypothetical protein